MKRLYLFFPLLSFVLAISVAASAQQTFRTTPGSVIGYLEYVPSDYHANQNRYPVVIFLHGRGERGPSSNKPSELERGVDKLVRYGPPHHVKKGTRFPFILISPQLKSRYGDWPLWYIMEVVAHVKKTLRVDESRIYLTGLSLGGGGVWTAAEEHPDIFAAIAPVCGSRNSRSKAKDIARKNLPVWAFHGDRDNIVPIARTAKMIEAINSYSPNPRAKFTTYRGVKHESWENAYKPDHSVHQPNVYEWMLSHRLNRPNQDQQQQQQQKSNSLPQLNIGKDRTITADVKSVELVASASDRDGKIVSYRWTKVSGGNIRVEGERTSKLRLSNLREGKYVFRLTVTDDKGGASADNIRVYVNAAPRSGKLLAIAGPDRTLKLPVKNYMLAAGATSPDAYIASYEWKQVDGPPLTLSNTHARVLTITTTTPGKRTFLLTVRDTKGRVAADHVRLYFEDPATRKTSFDETEVLAEPDNTVSSGDINAWEDQIVQVYNERGERVFSGQWRREYYAEVFGRKGLYIYQAGGRGKSPASGKIYVHD